MIDRSALFPRQRLAPMAIDAKCVKQPVDAQALVRRQRLVAGETVLLTCAIGKIVVTGGADEARVIAMIEIGVIDGR